LSKPLRIVTWILVGLFVLVRWQMLKHYPPENGFDSHGHIDYLNLVFQTGTLPRPNQLWQGYHAPAYFLISSKLAHLTGGAPLATGQLVTALCSVLLGVPGYLLARRLVPGWEPLAVLGLLMLPASVNTSPMVYSQQLATLMIGFFLVVLTEAWHNQRILLLRELALGVLWAASIWSRYDGFFLGLALGALWLKRMLDDRSQWLHASLALIFTSVVTLALISPSLLANMADFNQPVIRNRDARLFPYSFLNYGVLPNFLHPVALLNPGWELWLHPRSNNVESLPVSLFLRLWGANQVNALPSVVLELLGLTLSVYVVVGVKNSWRDRLWGPVYAVAAANVVLMAIFLAREPDLTGYKAIYFHGSYYLVALALTRGAQIVSRRWSGHSDRLLFATCLGPIALYALAYLMYWRA
jgi:hypothetical protein